MERYGELSSYLEAGSESNYNITTSYSSRTARPGLVRPDLTFSGAHSLLHFIYTNSDQFIRRNVLNNLVDFRLYIHVNIIKWKIACIRRSTKPTADR